MKKMILAVLIFLLLLTPTFVNVPEVSATTTEDLCATPALPEDVPRDPMPENFTTEDYLNTTNPYSDLASAQGVLDEVDDPEGDNPLHVLVFVDEEERAITRRFYVWWNWLDWAKLQIERGDESLVSNFGIDIRILDFLEWDSDDGLDSMYDLWDELEADGEQYLRQWYDGEWWSNYVDAIIGITAQATPGDPRPIAGLAPEDDLLDEGRNFILLKWQVYWMDDNLVQHEVSHLYYAPDHPEPQPPAPCCAMAYHPHYQTWIWEGDLWWVFNDIPCAYTSYSWCTTCHQVIQQNSGRYPLRTLTISASSGGTTNPAPGTYLYGNGASVTVTAQGYSRYIFDYWILDGATKYGNEITVTMDSDHDLTAYFEYIGYVGGCPTLFVWNGSGYVDYGVIDIHNPSGEDVVREVSIAEQDLAVEDLKVNLCLQEGWLGLEYSHSEIDRVKLYAVDNDGNRLLCPLKKATYNNYNVRPILKQGDDEKLDIYLLETVDLEFLVPYQNVQGFTFVIEGCNLSKV